MSVPNRSVCDTWCIPFDTSEGPGDGLMKTRIFHATPVGTLFGGAEPLLAKEVAALRASKKEKNKLLNAMSRLHEPMVARRRIPMFANCRKYVGTQTTITFVFWNNHMFCVTSAKQ